MICKDALKLDGYLKAMADIQSMADSDMQYDFGFEKINFLESPEESFRSYCEEYIREDENIRGSMGWLNLGNTEGERILSFIEESYNQVLSFKVINTFEKELDSILRVWITNRVVKYSENKNKTSVNNYILNYMMDELGLRGSKYWKLVCDSDFIYDAFFYNVSDIYILKIEDDYFILKFGVKYL
ncbi:hypothetical protein [uncultured Clostridium sp.]|jgi:hypothetical protein|uniref:hypothetical protein n=1 Tax=uncultured Clostridium sp. TaxID=59620 RepID=UPI00260A7F29|nr:hypothetical protein [uncultured Clostridium sp.]